MLMLGGKLKFKESLSGRLGDVLSQLYIASSMLKRHQDAGNPVGDQPLLAYAIHDAVNKIETALSGALRNFPIRPVGWLLWALIFPLGRRAQAPSDRLGHKVASLLMTPCDARERLAAGVFTTPCANNPAGRIVSYLPKVVMAEPVERKFLKALKNSDIEALDFATQLDEGVREGWITADERKQLEELRAITLDAIMVDDFDPEELRSAGYATLHGRIAARAAA